LKGQETRKIPHEKGRTTDAADIARALTKCIIYKEVGWAGRGGAGGWRGLEPSLLKKKGQETSILSTSENRKKKKSTSTKKKDDCRPGKNNGGRATAEA